MDFSEIHCAQFLPVRPQATKERGRKKEPVYNFHLGCSIESIERIDRH